MCLIAIWELLKKTGPRCRLWPLNAANTVLMKIKHRTSGVFGLVDASIIRHHELLMLDFLYRWQPRLLGMSKLALTNPAERDGSKTTVSVPLNEAASTDCSLHLGRIIYNQMRGKRHAIPVLSSCHSCGREPRQRHPLREPGYMPARVERLPCPQWAGEPLSHAR